METIIAWILIAIQSLVPLFHTAAQQVSEYVSNDVAPVVEVVQQKITDVASSSPALSVATSVRAVVREKVATLNETVVPRAVMRDSASAPTPAITASGVLTQTNIERYKEGLQLLTSDSVLTGIAQKKAQDMIAHNYFAHESPDGKTIGDLAKEAGYAYLSVGENLAMGDFASNSKLVTAWMNSPGHRANILNTAYTQIGIAAVRGEINGHEVWVAVQEFGVPQSACPAPDRTVRATLEALQNQITILDRKLAQQDAAIDEISHNDPERTTIIAQYNTAVGARNELATRYRTDAKRYNGQIEIFNTCLSTTLKKH